MLTGPLFSRLNTLLSESQNPLDSTLLPPARRLSSTLSFRTFIGSLLLDTQPVLCYVRFSPNSVTKRSFSWPTIDVDS